MSALLQHGVHLFGFPIILGGVAEDETSVHAATGDFLQQSNINRGAAGLRRRYIVTNLAPAELSRGWSA
jgi:hypothetical protein